jgi:hypothetical protein
MFSMAQLRHLYPSIKEHQRVESETLRLLKYYLKARYIADPGKAPGIFRYAQRNIFSILFLAVYRSLGIPLDKRIFYGVLNHCVRGIVTAADNILDAEYKEVLPLGFAEGATRFKSVMHLLLFDRFINQAIEDAVGKELISGCHGKKIQKSVFDAMVPIGAEEAMEEGGISEILSPSDILSSVHMYKGGNLLRLAFIAPKIVDTHLNESLAQADEGIYRIGMALQVIDDLTDFYSDIGDHRHNYLVSSVCFEGTPDEKEKLWSVMEKPVQAQPPIELAFPSSVNRVMCQAIGEALTGFDLLHAAGFWIDRKLALNLIRKLFHLRGVSQLLVLFPEAGISSATLAGDGRPFGRIASSK